jgi:uncharacterized protein (DUF1015 family)
LHPLKRLEAKNNPESVLHVTKSEIDLAEDIDIHSETVYEQAKENLKRFVANGLLARDDKPAYYIYQLIMLGWFACLPSTTISTT